MKIKIDNFLIEQETNAPDKFNLYEVKVKFTGKDIGGEVLDDKGYGMPFDKTLKLLTHCLLQQNPATVSLAEFILAFEQQLDRITKIAKKLQ